VGSFDLVFLGDIIEHFEKIAGGELLRQALACAHKAVVVTTPKFDTVQEDLCGNELERHRSLWQESDFLAFPNAVVRTVDHDTLLAVLPRSSALKLDLAPPRQPAHESLQRLREAREQIGKHLSPDQKFVLIDEEQLRASLPHAHAHPFLEQAGQYWGPPADAPTAIRELERMRGQGCRHVVFIWTTFWWLDHYPEFALHLRSSYRLEFKSDSIMVFGL
jgi:hypothetical protein